LYLIFLLKYFFFLAKIDAANSRLLGTSLPVSVKNALENEPTTSNYHNFCMRPEVNIFMI